MIAPRTDTRRLTVSRSGGHEKFFSRDTRTTQSGPVFMGNGAGHSTDELAPSRDVNYRPVQADMTHCPASGIPALIVWSPMLMLPDAPTVLDLDDLA